MGSAEPRIRFEELYMAHYPAVLSYVSRRTASPDDAADAMAETFTTAWRKLAAVPDGPDALFWLYAVARRVLANQHRGESRRTALADRLRAELRELEQFADPVRSKDHEVVRAVFRGLSAQDRELLALAGWEGLKATEIAKVLGCSHGTARIRLHRARKRLARSLAAAGFDLTSYGRATALLSKASS